MRRFQYHKPQTLAEASDLLKQYDGQASLLAGGTDLLVEMKEHLRRPEHVIDVKRIPGLAQLHYSEKSGLRFGALVTVRAIETEPVVQVKYAGLAQAVRELGSIQVRNRATVVGNICRASPSADTLPPLIADDARLHIYGPAGERTVPMEAFFTGPGKTVLENGEIVTEVLVPAPAPGTGKVYIKHGRRKAMELATVGVAVSLAMSGGRCTAVRIVLGAVAPTPIRALAAEKTVRGKKMDAEVVQEAAAAAMAEARPISDVRSSAEYRRQMVRALTARALRQAAARSQKAQEGV